MIDRRQFGRLAAGAALAGAGTGLHAIIARPALAAGRGRVVIVGGGAGGGTVARILKTEAPQLDVKLVEKRQIYTTCFNSNHYFGGFRTFASLQHSYDGLRNLGVEVMNERATGVDADAKSVTLADGTKLPYDRLVLAPGISLTYDAIEGYSLSAAETTMPHAWIAGPQTLLLMRQLEAMDDGGVVIMTVPNNPYRCPPGPYERACMIAHYLKTHKPRSKLVIFDAKPHFSKQPAFEEAFARYYDGIIDLNLTNEIDDFRTVRVDPKAMEIETVSGIKAKGAVVNVIPPQTAGEIAITAGCAEGGWCPIDPSNFTSAKVKDVYVIGDAAIANEMPKSAFTANSHGKVVAADILAALAGGEKAAARYRNTCWSLLAAEDTIKIGADYTPGERDGKPFLAPSHAFISLPGESAEMRRRNYEESLAWYHGIIADAFNDNTALLHKG